MKQALLANPGFELVPLSFKAVYFLAFVMCLLYLGIRFLKKRLQRRLPPLREEQQQQMEKYCFGHAAIVIYLLKEISWNTFDMTFWVVSYGAVGLFRNFCSEVSWRVKKILEDGVIDKPSQIFLRRLEKLATLITLAAISYAVGCLVVFRHATLPITTHLLYPTCRLLLSSVDLFIMCRRVRSGMWRPYNSNLRESFAYKTYGFLLQITCMTLQIYHTTDLISRYFKQPKKVREYFETPWILPLVWALLFSLKDLLSNCMDLYENMWLINSCTLCLQQTDSKEEICAICQEELEIACKVKKCGHEFHEGCIIKWMERRPMPDCPVCRCLIAFKPNDDTPKSLTKLYY